MLLLLLLCRRRRRVLLRQLLLLLLLEAGVHVATGGLLLLHCECREHLQPRRDASPVATHTLQCSTSTQRRMARVANTVAPVEFGKW